MDELRRWRSRLVPAGLIGASALVAVSLDGCTDAVLQQNVYGTNGDCHNDNDASDCQPNSTDANDTSVVGPVYRMRYGMPAPCHDGDPGPGSSFRVNSDGKGVFSSPPVLNVRIVQRGGFGATCWKRNSHSRGSYSSSGGSGHGGSWSRSYLDSEEGRRNTMRMRGGWRGFYHGLGG